MWNNKEISSSGCFAENALTDEQVVQTPRDRKFLSAIEQPGRDV